MRLANALPLALLPMALSACVIVVDGGHGDLRSSYVADGPLQPAEAETAPFDAVQASAGTSVTVKRGDGHRLVLDDDARARTTHEIDGKTLKITCRKIGMGRCVRGDKGEVVVYAPGLGGVSASSGAVLRVDDGFDAAPSLTVRASSGGVVDARAVRARAVDAKASSGGSARVTALSDLTARASSGGSVRYEGDPRTDVSTSSGGAVRRD